MSENSTIYEKAMTTGRPAKQLARKHGFRNVGHVAESLPEDAWVLDVGAGASSFGDEVARLRPDITWINFDLNYHDPLIMDEVSLGSQHNVQHVAGDATKLDQKYPDETFDAVFSYWLFPHLSLESIEPAQLAARGIFRVTKPGGIISIGPEMSKSRLPSIKHQKAFRLIKNEGLDIDDFVDMVAYRTCVRGYTRYVERLSNEVMTTFFGTTRYFKQEGNSLLSSKVYDPDRGIYINPLSLRGAVLAGRLTAAAARYVMSQPARQNYNP